MRYRAVLAYDGTQYHGFQRQAQGVPTIQAEVEQALANMMGQPISLVGAGRTDTGVHAVGQVIAFTADWPHGEQALLRAINAHLPTDIAVQSIQEHPGFHPRYHALSRTYCYTLAECDVRQPLLNQRAWQMRGPLDDRAMQTIAAEILGQHDFAAFGKPPQGLNTVRTVYQSQWRLQEESFGRLFVYTIEATAFLQHMVRRLVGMMVAVGLAFISQQTFSEIFLSGDIRRVRHIAPPQGLVLQAVRYPPVGADWPDADGHEDREDE